MLEEEVEFSLSISLSLYIYIYMLPNSLVCVVYAAGVARLIILPPVRDYTY